MPPSSTIVPPDATATSVSTISQSRRIAARHPCRPGATAVAEQRPCSYRDVARRACRAPVAVGISRGPEAGACRARRGAATVRRQRPCGTAVRRRRAPFGGDRYPCRTPAVRLTNACVYATFLRGIKLGIIEQVELEQLLGRELFVQEGTAAAVRQAWLYQPFLDFRATRYSIAPI